MSLIPLMKLRLAAPGEVVDLGRMPGLERDHAKAAAWCTSARWRRITRSRARRVIRAQVPAAGGDGGPHRRRAGAQYGDHRRQHRACRSGGGLSGGAGRARGEDPAGLGEVGPHGARPRNSSSTRSRRRSSRARSCSKCRCRWRTRARATATRRWRIRRRDSRWSGVAARIKKSGGKITHGAHRRDRASGRKAFRARQAEQLLESGAEVAAAVGDRRRGRGGQFGPLRLGDYRRHLARVYAARAIQTAHLEGFVKISGTYVLPIPQERAYALLQDPGGPGEVHAGLRGPGADRCGRIRHAHEDGAGQHLRPVPGQGQDLPSRIRRRVSACWWRVRARSAS